MLGPKNFCVGYRPLGQLPPEASVVLGRDLWVRGTWSASFHPRRSLYWVQTYGSGLYTRSVQLPAEAFVVLGTEYGSGLYTRSVQLPPEAFVVLGTDQLWVRGQLGWGQLLAEAFVVLGTDQLAMSQIGLGPPSTRGFHCIGHRPLELNAACVPTPNNSA